MQGRRPRAAALAQLALWIAGSCGTLPSAHAQASSYPDAAAAENVLIQRGIELRRTGEDRLALAEFERAFSSQGSVRALAQMALAEQALGLWREANEHLQRALQKDEPWIAEHRATLEAAAREIRSQLGALEISCNIAGAEVRLNGALLGLTPLTGPVPLVAGANVITVSKPGFFEMARQVGVDAGRLSRLDVVLTASPTASFLRPAQLLPSAVAAPPEFRAAAPVETEWAAREAFLPAVLAWTALGLSAGVAGAVMREVNAKRHSRGTRRENGRGSEGSARASAGQRLHSARPAVLVDLVRPDCHVRDRHMRLHRQVTRQLVNVGIVGHSRQESRRNVNRRTVLQPFADLQPMAGSHRFH